MSPPPGCSPFPRRMITRTSRDYQREATRCGDNLFWRITNNTSNDDKTEMLLSFDIHNEKLHFIHLPIECTQVPMNEHQYVEVDHHLLEFKGYPCVARSEKIIINNRYHHHQCIAQRRFCRCCFKVHLYVLKNKLQQVWEKEESFDIQMEEGSLPVPFCCYCGTTASSTTATDATTTIPPTRMLSFSDQVILYWFNGTYLVFYNLQMKHFEVVNCCNEENRAVFEVKMKGIPGRRRIGEDDRIYCPYMDYQLHAQVENILSLKTFIPEGGTCKLVDGYHGFQTYVEHNIPTGWLCTGKDRSILKYYIYV
ncbi:uncharacterized protein LOC113301217 isoform X1 [Papaver somniferum]|uniref:uncharacterized protein LOC113301217 isoform X1 n=1 Tax=Papaver somniferum TaxID=3469 RepID=UPI000E6F4B6E|nr:uncharacterized protein LOC113301217 isoform X1 [Papaver somniferum]